MTTVAMWLRPQPTYSRRLDEKVVVGPRRDVLGLRHCQSCTPYRRGIFGKAETCRGGVVQRRSGEVQNWTGQGTRHGSWDSGVVALRVGVSGSRASDGTVVLSRGARCLRLDEEVGVKVAEWNGEGDGEVKAQVKVDEGGERMLS
jgi:hypothetical protein